MRTIQCALLAIALAGCGKTLPCKSGTVLVSLELEGAAASADTLSVAITADGATASHDLQHRAGVAHGSIEVDFPSGYHASAQLTIAITATSGGAVVGRAEATMVLPARCGALALTVAAAADAGVDQSGAVDDLSGLDLAPPPDLACQPCADGSICCAGACTSIGLVNCGACGAACDTTSGHSSSASCVQSDAGVFLCAYTCTSPYADCDSTVAPNTNGCESNLTSAATCGSCALDCTASSLGHACFDGGCGCGSVGDCSASVANACATVCQCGSGAACNPATQACTGSACKLADGQPCSQPSQCASGACQKTQSGTLICNNGTCGTCQVAAADGSGCVTTMNGTDPTGSCTGNNNGHVCQNGACGCSTKSDCGVTADGCATTCRCGSNPACNPATQACASGACSLANGQPCASPAACASKNCQATQSGSLVCDSTTCGACSVATSQGNGCVNATDGTDPKADCTGNNNGMVCESGACGCGSAGDCNPQTADSCGALFGGATCTCGGAAPCNPSTQQCASGICLLANGQTCSLAKDCASGDCVATQTSGKVCCSTACGTCQVCNANGVGCVATTNGTDPSGSCATNSAGHVCESGACGCGSNADCSNGLAPFCTTSSICGCGTTAGPCKSGQRCTSFTSTGKCLAAPGVTCSLGSTCASNSCSVTCSKLISGQPCTGNADCQSGTCTPTGC